MKILQIIDSEALDEAAFMLKNGGLVMHPTETCYGIAVDIFNEKALGKLYKVKGRDAEKPVSILVDSLEMAMEYGIFSDKALELAHEFWPGALSFVVPRKKRLPEFLNKGEKFVSIRFSSDSFITDVVKFFEGPITTTSANLAGMPPLYEVDLCQFGDEVDQIDLVVDGGVLSQNKPSTVVKVEGNYVEVLRQGDVLV